MNPEPQPRHAAKREALVAAIAQEDALIARLENEQVEARGRIAGLRAELSALGAEPEIQISLPVRPPGPVPRTAAEKVRLFRDLFRGRGDVFPTRFVSKKTGKPGYAPACSNKFVGGVCELPRIKCSECPNQAFTAVDDRSVVDHLRGRHVMGVYPLLDDDPCDRAVRRALAD